jgi:hypothetical protein
MKTLMAIISHAGSGMRPTIRETWVPQVPKDKADVMFFVGRDYIGNEADVVKLDCNDSYQGLIEKVREVSRWAYSNGYDFFMKIDDDVVVLPEKLFNSDFYEHEFVGCDNGDSPIETCRCGKKECRQRTGVYITPWGFHYVVSRKGMGFLNIAELPPHSANDECWVAHVLGEQGILLHNDGRYFIHTGFNPHEGPPDQSVEPVEETEEVTITKKTVPRLGRPGRVLTVYERMIVKRPKPTAMYKNGHGEMTREQYEKSSWLVKSKFTLVQSTPETFSFCVHLVWKGYHCTPVAEVIAEFKKIYSDPSKVWFDRRCFGGGSWRTA